MRGGGTARSSSHRRRDPLAHLGRQVAVDQQWMPSPVDDRAPGRPSAGRGPGVAQLPAEPPPLTSLAQVAGPAMPSAASPLAFWNAVSLPAVAGPKTPSAVTL